MKIKIIFLNIFLFIVAACNKTIKEEEAGRQMQEFVNDISDYARHLDSNFIIIPQNGLELCFNYLDPTEKVRSDYMSAIDGVGVEELFYNGDFMPDDYRLDMLQAIKNGAKVLVSEYVNDDNNIGDALTRSQNEGFLCFVRDSGNYDYKEIPATVPNENTNNITSLIEAQNHLYLIGADFPTKQDMISAIAATNFDIVLIDLFFGDTAFTAAEIAQLKIKNNGAQRLVISYINVGAAEKYRYYWQDGWSLGNPKWLKKHYDGYPDEFWVEYWHKEWKDIIFGNNDSYMKKIIDAGFDGAYLDNVEAYYFLYHD